MAGDTSARMLQRQGPHAAHTHGWSWKSREKKREGRRSTFHDGVCAWFAPDDAAHPPYHARNQTNIRFQSTSQPTPSLPRGCAGGAAGMPPPSPVSPPAAAAAAPSLAPIHLSPVLTPLSSSHFTASPAVTANTQSFAQQPQRPRDVAGHQKARACGLWHSKSKCHLSMTMTTGQRPRLP